MRDAKKVNVTDSVFCPLTWVFAARCMCLRTNKIKKNASHYKSMASLLFRILMVGFLRRPIRFCGLESGGDVERCG
jgi:hypothetical protein